jgi:RimJ/RimL family protein N-acetyltransferase
MNPDPWLDHSPLEGRLVRLEPMSGDHIPGLIAAGSDPSIWEYMVYGNLSVPANMSAWVWDILDRQKAGTDRCFTVFHLPSGRIAGATRYLEMRPPHLSLEVGGTWYSPEFQRTGVNTECKYLLLRNAFEVMGCIRVQFKADERNLNSIRSIERLGAHREGLLRNQFILPDGTRRNSVFFSIINDEWPEVKKHLEGILSR